MGTKAKPKDKPKPKPKPKREPRVPAALPPGTPAMLSIEQVAAMLGVTSRFVRKLMATGSFPEADSWLGGSLQRWRVATVEKWIDSQPRENTSGRHLPANAEGG